MGEDKDLIEQLRAMRAAGVKGASFHPDGALSAVEFFPVSVLEQADALDAGPAEALRDTEPPAPTEAPMPPALRRLLQKGSIS